ncbi:ATP-binding protein [Bacillus mycoides]|uniref:ATP-binding protein n=1 Tax=Bacillus mycoides TaxID=1405 RepID=UPI000AB62630|nr:ATP-binding protein [Bacillus mycoides]MCQ6568140.1 ATP-binding protein [Bacillus mycoides]MED1404647.1 ATP-binding protein [Bacillus mycoides]
MIDVQHLKYAEIHNITVKASNNIFHELGNNTYTFVDLISELIDNSIAAMLNKQFLEINIEIGLSENDKDSSYFLIRDNASGIPQDKIGIAISPAALSGGTSLNEHGLGMKQAVASMGKLKYLATKTIHDSEALVIQEFKFGKIRPKTLEVEWGHGTEICVERLKDIVPRAAQTYTKSISTYLGARYRRLLRHDNPKMKLNIKLLDLDDCTANGLPSVINDWEVKEIKPIYFHPNKRRNAAVVPKQLFNGTGWKASLTFGYAPTDDEYEEMGLEKPKQYEPYKVSLPKQGFDIIRNDRVIQFSQLSELKLVAIRHNKYNYIRGEIELIKGFTTSITKNSIVQNAHFDELLIQVKEFLEEKQYLERRTFPDEIPENLLRDRLAIHLKTRTIDPKTNVKTEYAIEGLGGFIDILADGEAWELKINKADGLDVYQLFAYMDMGNINTGFLIAPDFKTGAHSAKDFINLKHEKQIFLVKTSELPILSSPTAEDIKKYY